MSQNRGQSKVKKQSMQTRSQLPELPQNKTLNNMRSRSQLMDQPIKETRYKSLFIYQSAKQVLTKRLHQRLRFLRKDLSSHTSCTSSETCHTNDYPINDLIIERQILRHSTRNSPSDENSRQSRNQSPDQSSILSDRTLSKEKDIVAEKDYSSAIQVYAIENEDEYLNVIDDLQGKSKFEDFRGILPIQIQNFTIKQVSWDDFTASSDANSQWKAHTFWCIGYTYDIKMRKLKKSTTIRYRLIISSWAALTEKCWVRFKWSRLLEHETGHYLIGCICALEFKKRADAQKYTQNYRIEAQKLFNSTFNEYLQLELLYDKETDHSRNVEAQKQWNLSLISQLEVYQTFFGEESQTKNDKNIKK